MRLLPLLLTVLLASGCASVYKPHNTPVQGQLDPSVGYRAHTADEMGASDNRAMLILSFSGGGTRAAALSYGVLKELRDTPVPSSTGKPARLLDEIDMISSVSGGSFTAAYYGLYGDDIFRTYEDRFLKQSIQGTLIRKLFNPVYWARSIFSAFDRTEMAVDYYDTYIFRGATFKDMPHNKPPFIEINATDLNAGARFSFTQRYFDLICSNLDDFSVARAVTASSAVPLLFPSVVLENHSDQCAIDKTPIGLQMQRMAAAEETPLVLRSTLESYRNRNERPYIHLVDGGITDNLGVRAVMDRLITLGYQPGINDPFTQFDHVAFIVVNAEVKPRRTIDQTAEKPGIAKTVDAVSSAQIAGITLQTRQALQRGIKAQNDLAKAQGIPQKFHYIEISFEDVASRKRKDYLNNLPTSLELDSEQVDEVIDTGRHLLRNSTGYQNLLTRLRDQ